MAETRNAFLGGRLQIVQPQAGYRAGADPVFLAAAVPAQPGDAVLDLGCGAGTAMLCLLARVPGACATGVEREPEMAALARRNLAAHDMAGEVVEGDIAALPEEVRARVFDHVMMNPPFFSRRRGTGAADATREAGRGECTELSTWLDTGLRRLKPQGILTIINRMERLPDCLSGLANRAGDVVVLPLQPRVGRGAKLFILQAKKGAKGPFRLAAPFVLHAGARHEKDGDSYTEAADHILRSGQALPIRD